MAMPEEIHMWSWPPSIATQDKVKQIFNYQGLGIDDCFSVQDVPQGVKKYNYISAAHGAIFARTNNEMKAAIMMQMRADGKIGFPGGFIDETDPSVVSGLNRELREEINLDMSNFEFTDDDFLTCTFVPNPDRTSSVMRHLYAKEVTLEEFVSIERNAKDARDFGLESLGQIRVPVHTFRDKCVLKVFQKNQFPGGAVKPQLFWMLYAKKILDFNVLVEAFGFQRQGNPHWRQIPI